MGQSFEQGLEHQTQDPGVPYLPVYNARPCIIRTLILATSFGKKTQTQPKVYFCKIMFIELTTTGK